MQNLWTHNPWVLVETPHQRELRLAGHRRLAESQPSDALEISNAEEANSTARFVLLWAILSTALASGIRSVADKRVSVTWHFLVVGAAMLLFAGVHVEQTIPRGQAAQELKYCQAPTTDNPMANPLPADYGDGLKLPACPSDAVTRSVDAKIDGLPITSVIAAEADDLTFERRGRRSFYSVPVTTVPQNVENFRNALYGGNLSRRVDHGFDKNIFSA